MKGIAFAGRRSRAGNFLQIPKKGLGPFWTTTVEKSSLRDPAEG